MAAATKTKSTRSRARSTAPEADETIEEIEETSSSATSTGISTRRASTTRNAGTDIDFSEGKSADDLASEQAQTRGTWIIKLAALRDGVEAGKGAFDTFYKIGEFGNASGARTVIRDLGKRPERIPGAFDLEPRIVRHDDGTRTSELWAAVPSD